MQRADLPLKDGVRELLRAAGFAHSFEAASMDRADWPPLSAWNGALVDHLYVRARGGATVQVLNTGVYLSDASDHLPILADLKLQSNVKS